MYDLTNCAHTTAIRSVLIEEQILVGVVPYLIFDKSEHILHKTVLKIVSCENDMMQDLYTVREIVKTAIQPFTALFSSVLNSTWCLA